METPLRLATVDEAGAIDALMKASTGIRWKCSDRCPKATRRMRVRNASGRDLVSGQITDRRVGDEMRSLVRVGHPRSHRPFDEVSSREAKSVARR